MKCYYLIIEKVSDTRQLGNLPKYTQRTVYVSTHFTNNLYLY